MNYRKLVVAMALVVGAGVANAGPGHHHGKGWKHKHSHNHHKVVHHVVHHNSRVSQPYGEVVQVEPVYQWRNVVREEQSCVKYKPGYRGVSSYTPSILGAVIGGALGHRIGDAHGDPNAAAIAGGLLGASIGHDIGRNNAYRRGLEVSSPCRTQYHSEPQRELVEYRVTYRYNGQTYHTTMDQHPGDWIKLDVEVRPA